jgi:hypothetical protein
MGTQPQAYLMLTQYITFPCAHLCLQEEPLVLPAKVPHLLVNGTQGIAVGIATKIPPHNLREVVAALRALVEQPDISTAQLMRHIPAPDFPTGGCAAFGVLRLKMCKLLL